MVDLQFVVHPFFGQAEFNVYFDPMKEVFKSSVATLRFDPEYNLVYLIWDGAITFDKYKEPFLFLLSQFKPEVVGIISDIRKQGVVGPEMRTWLQKEVTPRSKERGLKFFYVVSDANVFKHYYVNTIFRLLQGSDQIERKLFQDFDKCDTAIKASIAQYKSRIVGSNS